MDGSSPSRVAATELQKRQLSLFVRNFIRHPRMVGTLTPSSRWVVARLVDAIDFERARCIVEYGPGLGTITAALLERMHPRARLLVIETNGEFVDFLRSGFDDRRLTVVHGSAEDVAEALARHRLGAADCVISGIPLSTLPRATREQVLARTASILADDGRLLVYQYSNSARRHLRQHFELLSASIEWRNLLPMHLFVCRGDGDRRH